MKELEQGEAYKYLGVEEADGIREEYKEKI